MGYLEELLDYQNFQWLHKRKGTVLIRGTGRDDVGSASLMSDIFKPKGNFTWSQGNIKELQFYLSINKKKQE